VSFYSKLSEKLEGKLPKKTLDKLPRSYFLLGDVITLKLNGSLLKSKRQIGAAILEVLPYARSVVLIKDIKGTEREPKAEVIAGSRKTETVHREHGCLFALDPAKIMWSKGNKAERQRMMAIAGRGENVVDMFAGVGYWTVPMAKHGNVTSIKAIDINPVAIKYLKKNIALNRTWNVEVLKGDCKEHAETLADSADRVIMGWLYGTERFLPAALKIAKTGGIIHFHDTVPEKEVPNRINMLKDIAAHHGCFLDVDDIQLVKGYSPGVNHYVYDLVKA
jgi:tRNA wybutosine-synthesizing protein 2